MAVKSYDFTETLPVHVHYIILLILMQLNLVAQGIEKKGTVISHGYDFLCASLCCACKKIITICSFTVPLMTGFRRMQRMEGLPYLAYCYRHPTHRLRMLRPLHPCLSRTYDLLLSSYEQVPALDSDSSPDDVFQPA